MSRSLNSVIVRSGLVKLWKNPRVVKNYATYFTSYIVLYNVMQAILYSAFNYKIIDLKFYWINWLRKLVINIICFPYEDTSYSARLKTTRKDLLLKQFKENLLVTSTSDLEKEENIYKKFSNNKSSSITSKTITRNNSKYILAKLQILLLMQKLIKVKKNLISKLKKLQLHSRILALKKLSDFRCFYKIFKTNSLLRQKRYRKAAVSLACLYKKYKNSIQISKKEYDSYFSSSITELRDNYLKLILNKITSKIFIHHMVNLNKKGNLSKKDMLIQARTLFLKDLVSYKAILEKKVDLVIAQIKRWFWCKINHKQKTKKKLYRMKILYIYFWFNIIKFSKIETRIRQKIQSTLVINISNLKTSKKFYLKPILTKITYLIQMLSNKMRVSRQYKDYLENKYLASRKTFYLLSQEKLANKSIFGKVNHGILRYTNNNSFVKTTSNALILKYIRPLLGTSKKSSIYKTNNLLKETYFQKLRIFSENKVKILKTLNKANNYNLKTKVIGKSKKNNRIKIFNTNLKNSPIKTYNIKSMPNQITRISKIRSNRAISLKLKELLNKMKAKDLFLKNYISKEIQRLVLTYVNLFHMAHKHFIDKKINALKIQKFMAAKIKTKRAFVNRNKAVAKIYSYKDQWWLYRAMATTKAYKQNNQFSLSKSKNQAGVWLNFKLNMKKCQSLYKNEIKLLEYQTFMPLLYKTIQKVQRRKNIFFNVFLSELLGKNIQCLIFNPTAHYLIPRINQRLTINHYKTLAMPRIYPHKANRYYLNSFNVVWHILTFKTEGMSRLLAEHLARELRKDRRHYLVLQSITDIFEKVFQISKKNTPADLEHLRAIKIEVRGKIKGSERKRKYAQTLISNELPLLNHTATVDMAMAATDTVYGALGIKVWILYN